MATPFLGSEEYDERAHRLYEDGDYDAALSTLREGLELYPTSVELHVGMGYTRMAREEYAWARRSFAEALALDPDHEEALVGLGEVLLRLGRREEALELFRRARAGGAVDDLDLLLSMGRALYRERLLDEAFEVFSEAAALYPESPEATAALGYVQYRQGRPGAAKRSLREALRLEPAQHDARVFLAHLLYDEGNWKAALRELERVAPEDHWDPVAIWRVIELKRVYSADGTEPADIRAWERRLEELEAASDPIDELLAEIEQMAEDPEQRRSQARAPDPEARPATHQVRTSGGQAFAGSWIEIVSALRADRGLPGENLAQFMRRLADELRARRGVDVPTDDPERFLWGCARAGLLRIEF